MFYLKFGLHLDEYTIAEMFSNHLNDKLEIGCAFEIINQDPTSGGRQVTNWIHLLDEMEIKLNLSITNKYEVAVTLHNTSVLNEEDITANYLLFDYKKSYLNFYQKEHPRIYEAFVTSVEKLMQADNAQVSKELINQLTYCFFITWENSFLKVNQKDEKVRLLVIERSYNSVGNFLKKYIGEFFSITNFDELDCLTIDLVEIEKQYDVIVTDVMVGKSEELEIFFFYKMIPEAIIDRLNEFLNVSFTDNNVMVKNLEAPSSSKSHSDKEVQKPEKPDNSVKQATSS
ncbi:M protein trans-acting positive regulator (Mga) [Streptococcus pyogenes]|nr:M protein trans-acting positive regulator (Mga) [Streptococcus pyogenes]